MRYIYVMMVGAMCCSCGSKKDDGKATTDQTATAAVVDRVVGIGKIIPEHDIIQLSTPVGGIVQKILKNENDSVVAGMPILELEHRLEDGRVRQLTSELNTQTQQVRADEASVEEYEAKYTNAQTEVQRLQRLLDKGAETRQAVDDAITGMKTYESNLKRLRAGVAVSKSRLEQTRASLQVAEIERDQRIIKSPVDGKLLEMSTLPGSYIDTRQPFAQVSPWGNTIAVCEIDEMYADKVVAGQQAWIKNVGSADTLSSGSVYSALSFLQKKSLFTDESGEKEDRRVRTIKILLQQPEGLLLNARVECVVNVSGYLK